MSSKQNGDTRHPEPGKLARLRAWRTAVDDEQLFRSATGQMTGQEDRRVGEWLDASDENRQRMDEIVQLLGLAQKADGELRFGPAPTAEKILSRRTAKDRVWSACCERRPPRGLFLAVAALAVLAVVAPLAFRLPVPQWAVISLSPSVFGPDEFATEKEPATVGLRDGSVVRLAPESRLRVHTHDKAREVSLAGRGYFAVAHNEPVPFTIRSDAGTVTVLGTRFDLTATGDDLRLIVIEGLVRLTVRGAHVDVRAGQLAQVVKGNLVPPIDVPDPAALVAWIGDFIAFQNTPLATVAREVERLHGVRIEFSDPELENRTVTALFAGRSFDEIAEVICAIAQLQCTHEGEVLSIAPLP